MELQLKNIGMIKEANVKIDGLTVIAGENDTGKSSLGKVLLTIFFRRSISFPPLKKTGYKKRFKKILFFDLESNSEICFFNNDNEEFIFSKNTFKYIEKQKRHITFIETPLILNLFEFLSSLDTLKDELGDDLEYDITNYPYTIRKLFRQLKLKLLKKSNIKLDISSIIGGSFRISNDKIILVKNAKEFNVNSLAMGIKSFGIIQLLLKNGYLKDGTILILDEPEVHLHPKWQLEMAKIIVELVKNGVKILVNSHSPYMIEALQRYSELEKVNSDFYLAEDGYINKIDNSNSQTLVAIYEKLSEPYDIFEQMESERFQNG